MLSKRNLRVIDLIRGTARRHTEQVAGIEELHSRLGRPLRVAVARIDGIGDWLLTLPLIMALRNSDHVSSLTLLSAVSHRELLERGSDTFRGTDLWATHHTPWPHGAIGKMLAISRIGQRRAWLEGSRLRGQFDLIVLPRWDTDRGQNLRFLAVGAGAEIAGHDPFLQPQASAKERREGQILTIICRDSRQHAHEADRIAALAKELGVTLSADESPGRDFFALPEVRTPRKGVVVMHTSAHDAFRCWPAEYWAKLVSEVLAIEGTSVTLVGSPHDRTAHQQLVRIDPTRVRSAANEVGLGALPNLLDKAKVFVGNDSGPAHFAAVIGVPTIVISCFPDGDDPAHPNSPDRFGVRSAGGSSIVRPPAQTERFEEMSTEKRDGLISQVRVEDVLRELRGKIGFDTHD